MEKLLGSLVRDLCTTFDEVIQDMARDQFSKHIRQPERLLGPQQRHFVETVSDAANRGTALLIAEVI